MQGNLGGHTKLGPDGLPIFNSSITVFLQVYATKLMLFATVRHIDTLSDRIRLPIALPWRTHLHQDIDLTLLPQYLPKSSIPQTDLDSWFDGRWLGHRLLLRNAIRMLSDFPGLDDVLWPASAMLRVSPDVLCDRDHKYDHGLYDPYDPMADDMEVTDAFTTEDCGHWHFPFRWPVSLDLTQPQIDIGLCLLSNSVCGISVARLIFFVQAGKGFDNAYDVTCKLCSGRGG